MKNNNFLTVTNLTHRYDTRTTSGIDNLNFEVNKSECLALIGPSGSGKTTTLKCLAGLIPNKEQFIQFQEEQSISYVSQFPNLDEELTVFQNLEKEIMNIEESEKRENQIRSTLALLEITNEIHSHVSNISGGQRQRVIMAQALVKNPTLLLLDEPFANLDKILRLSLLEELFEIFKDKKITVIWVTHNTEEALSYAQRAILLHHGKVQQDDLPLNLYLKPRNMFTAKFFGHTNIIASKIESIDESEIMVNIFKRSFIIPRPESFEHKSHNDILLIIRPELLCISKDPTKGLRASVKDIQFKGSKSLAKLSFKDYLLWCEFSSYEKIRIGDKINITLDTKNIYCLDEI